MTQVSDTDLSIIIPVYQVSEELLLRCLKSVQEIQDLRKEVTMPAGRGFFSWMQMITSVQMLLGKSVPC